MALKIHFKNPDYLCMLVSDLVLQKKGALLEI
jgi:hypothetical protein